MNRTLLTVRELGDRLVCVLETADNVRKGGGGPEVLLLQTELLTDYMRKFEHLSEA